MVSPGCATSTAFCGDANGCASVPGFESLPPGATNKLHVELGQPPPALPPLPAVPPPPLVPPAALLPPLPPLGAPPVPLVPPDELAPEPAPVPPFAPVPPIAASELSSFEQP